ncbi:MAG: metallophosphoesterase family protein [Terriglobales bacterium]
MSKHVLRTYFCCALLLISAAQLACHKKAQVAQVSPAPAPPLDKPDIVLAPAKPSFKFVAYGDIRFTAPGPVTVREVSNPIARDAIVADIVKQKPEFVLISGDLVWRGANEADWRRYDQEIQPLTDAKVPIFPTVGNHEYLNSDFVGNGRSQGLRNFFARFPQLPDRPATPWYSIQYGNCYFLMLDSEDDDAPGSQQMIWVQHQLDSLPNTTDYVFLMLHRPPHTAAHDGGHRERLPEIELGRMLEARQQRAPRPRFIVIAGHVHNYERYQRNGVTYIVSGGGGAHPHPLTRGADDLYHPQDSREVEYHYCLITVDQGKLRFEMRRLEDAASARFAVRDSVEMNYASGP